MVVDIQYHGALLAAKMRVLQRHRFVEGLAGSGDRHFSDEPELAQSPERTINGGCAHARLALAGEGMNLLAREVAPVGVLGHDLEDGLIIGRQAFAGGGRALHLAP